MAFGFKVRAVGQLVRSMITTQFSNLCGTVYKQGNLVRSGRKPTAVRR